MYKVFCSYIQCNCKQLYKLVLLIDTEKRVPKVELPTFSYKAMEKRKLHLV